MELVELLLYLFKQVGNILAKCLALKQMRGYLGESVNLDSRG